MDREKKMEYEFCPEYKEWVEWFERVANPVIQKFLSHLVNCPICQGVVFGNSDATALNILKMSREDLIEAARRFAGSQEDNY